MEYDFDYYDRRDLVYPKSPTKPRLSQNANSEEARTYANELATYEHAMAFYRYQVDEYRAQSNQRIAELRDRVRDDYNLTQAQFDLLWHKAWEDGHSCGLHEVLYHFDDLYDFVKDFVAAK